MKRKTIPLAEIEQQIYSKRGTISAVAAHFKVARSTIYRRIEEQPALAEALHDARQKLIDTAEERLFQRIEEGDTTAIIFFLKTQGQERGYGQRRSVTGTNQDWVKVLRKAANK